MKKKIYFWGAIFVIIMFIYYINSRISFFKNSSTGGMSTYHYFMIGTVITVDSDNNTILIEPHDKSQDLDFKYKSILYNLTDENIILKYSKRVVLNFNGYDGDLNKLQKGDNIFFSCFANDINKRPMPVNSIELLYEE